MDSGDDSSGQPGPDNDERVREHALPGPARLFEIRLTDGSLVAVAIDAASNRRRLCVLAPDDDTPTLRLDLDAAQAAAIAAFLIGPYPAR